MGRWRSTWLAPDGSFLDLRVRRLHGSSYPGHQFLNSRRRFRRHVAGAYQEWLVHRNRLRIQPWLVAGPDLEDRVSLVRLRIERGFHGWPARAGAGRVQLEYSPLRPDDPQRADLALQLGRLWRSAGDVALLIGPATGLHDNLSPGLASGAFFACAWYSFAPDPPACARIKGLDPK